MTLLHILLNLAQISASVLKPLHRLGFNPNIEYIEMYYVHTGTCASQNTLTQCNDFCLHVHVSVYSAEYSV